jgi:large subunit ribosomal protein L22
MEAIAIIKYIRVSPKKMREIAHRVVGLTPQQALDRLQFTGVKSAKVLSHAIESALGNATKNHKLNLQNLKIKTVEIGKGPHLKRWQPVSRGMAHQIKKRTAHIKVVLTEVGPKTKEIKEIEKVKQPIENQKVVNLAKETTGVKK